MGRPEDLVKLDQIIKEAEQRIKTLQANIDASNKELNTLSTYEQTLEENIKCLKRKQIIAIAQEFKKSKEELKKTRTRIAMLNSDKGHYVRSSKDVHAFIKIKEEELERLQKSADCNVLAFKPGRKDGKG